MEIIIPEQQEQYNSYINRILESRKRNKDYENYQEKHHIIPKCLNGTDDENNLIWLYAQEHFYAHKLLALENPHHSGLQFAFWNMCQCGKSKRKEALKDVVTAQEYELARIAHIKEMSQRNSGENNPMYGKFKELSPMYQKHHSDKAKAKMSSYQSNRTKEHKEKLIKNHADVSGSNNPNYGKPMSEEQKKKISEARKGKYTGEDHPFATKIQCVETQENFPSIKSAVNWCGGNPHINDCINGKRKSAGRHPVTGERLHWVRIT